MRRTISSSVTSSTWVEEGAGAVAVELFLHRAEDLAAGVDGPLEPGIDVLDVETEPGARSSEGLRAPEAALRRLLAQHDARVADLDLGVGDRPVGHRIAGQLLGAKGFLVELERGGGALDDEVGGHGVVSIRDRLHGHGRTSLDLLDGPDHTPTVGGRGGRPAPRPPPDSAALPARRALLDEGVDPL